MGKRVRKRKPKKPYRGFFIFFKVQLALMIVLIAAVAYYYLGGYGKEIEALHEKAVEIVNDATYDSFKENQTSMIFDVNGKLISSVKGEKDVYYIRFEDIPPKFVDAIISIEDKKFYKHKGIDFKAIIRAAWAMIRNGKVKQGGSTITQQLARTVFLSNERTWQRKVTEIYIALLLEQKFTKNEILEFYFNNVYFANGYYGIEAASRGYFDVSVDELSLSQIAFLCAIPNSPTRYDPVVSMDGALLRRDKILNHMLKDESISKKEYDEAIDEVIELNRHKETRHNYVETYARYAAIRELMRKKGFEFQNTFASDDARKTYEEAYNVLYEECQATLFTAGYRIYTSIDLDIQNKLQESIDNNLSDYKEKNNKGVYKFQSAGVCIDNITGKVVAIVGGRSQKTRELILNRAFQSYRQPGSAIKPLIVYTPMFERGLNPESIVLDEETEGAPKQKSYLGEMTVRRAVELSRNTIAWNLFSEVTPKKGLEYLLNMHFNRIDKEDYRLPASLGGFTNGTSPLEMAAAYETLVNDGYYRAPTCIIKITDAEGNEILTGDTLEEQVYKTNATRMMVDCMKGVLTEGTAKGLYVKDMPCAGKTGTTNDNKDGWFVGFTYYYTTSVWVGYDMPKKLDELQGATYPARIWQDFMNKLHDGLKPMEFRPYVYE